MIPFAKRYTARRFSAPTTTKGRVTPGEASEFDVSGSVQPLRPDDVRVLPEGKRESKAFRFYSEYTLKTLESKSPDQVHIDGEWYEVTAKGRWTGASFLNHNLYYLVKT